MCEWLYDLYMSIVAFIMSFIGPIIGIFKKSVTFEDEKDEKSEN